MTCVVRDGEQVNWVCQNNFTCKTTMPLPDGCDPNDGWTMARFNYCIEKGVSEVYIYDILQDNFVKVADLFDESIHHPGATYLVEFRPVRIVDNMLRAVETALYYCAKISDDKTEILLLGDQLKRK